MLYAGVCLAALSCSLDQPVSEVTLAITVGVSSATVPTAGSVAITITAQNYGEATITLTAPPQCLLFFQIHAPGGDIVFRSIDECGGNPTTRDIPAGEEFSMTVNWDGRGNTGTRLVGGTYLLRAGALLSTNAVLGSSLTINIE
jgi:hypothetical protein